MSTIKTLTINYEVIEGPEGTLVVRLPFNLVEIGRGEEEALSDALRRADLARLLLNLDGQSPVERTKHQLQTEHDRLMARVHELSKQLYLTGEKPA